MVSGTTRPRGRAVAAVLAVAAAVAATTVAGAAYEGPSFAVEPPSVVQFTNTSGTRLDCRGRGAPPLEVRWTLDSGDPVSYVSGVREALPNGSLYFHPFPGRLFRLDVHGGRYRCVVSNRFGKIISRAVRLKPVVLQTYEVTAGDARSPPGQSALLTCRVPAHVRSAVRVTSWAVDGALNVYPTLFGDDKHHMLPSGELMVHDVSEADARRRYICRTVHMMTDQHVVSTQPATIILDDPPAPSNPPRIVASSAAQQLREGEDAVLFCVGRSGQSEPRIRWSRGELESSGSAAAPPVVEKGVTARGALLVFRPARPSHSGWYSCRLQDGAGHASADLYMEVLMVLSVSVTPPRLTVNRGAGFRLTCSAPRPASLLWLRNGERVDAGHQLVVTEEAAGDLSMSHLEGADMKLSDQGMYQCFASSKVESVQAEAQLVLGDSHPVLLERFINHTVQPRAAVSLKCVANAAPTPQIRWLLDGFPLRPDHRRLIGQYVTANNDVISHVNISSVQPADGGWIACHATNRFGSVSHTARLNVYGDPLVREMPDVTAVEGEPTYITCSVGGYPIHKITWQHAGQTLPANRHQTVFPNGTLLIEHVQRAESGGTYSCTAQGDREVTSTGRVNLQVLVPPSIRPFMVGNYSTGERVQVLCFVKRGDTPLTLSWLRDGRPLDDPEVEQRSTDRYSSSLIIERAALRHAGNYTCRAENAARASSYTAELRVNVPPKWVKKPQDVAASLGSNVVMPCSAEGFPAPEVKWKKKDVGGFELPAAAVSGVDVMANGTLFISSVAAAHEGAYLCEVYNGVGVGLSTMPRLEVFAMPSFTTATRHVRAREGQNVTLTCDPAGDEPMTLQWLHENQPLQEDVRLHIRHWTGARNASRSTLRLLEAVPPDSGFFSCVAKNSRGEARLSVSLEIEDTPLPPSDLKVVEVQSRAVTIEWRLPDQINKHVTDYRLQYTRSKDGWDSARSVPLPRRRVQLTGLRPDTTYLLRALTLTALGPSPPSRPLSIRTDEEAPSRPPQQLDLLPLTSTDLRVTWRPPPADARHGLLLGYRVVCRRVSAAAEDQRRPAGPPPPADPVRVQNVTATATRLPGLRPFTQYEVTVQAYNSRGLSPRSAPARARTLQDVPSAPPRQLACEAAGPRQLQLSWQPPPPAAINGNLRGYQVKVEAVDEVDGQLFYSVYDVSERTTMIEGLRPYSNYSARVAAVTGVGAGVSSQPLFCLTREDEPGEPAAVGVAVTSPSSALVSWLPPRQPNGVITEYSVYIRSVTYSDETHEERRAVRPPADSHLLQGLSGRSEYAVRVSAHTAAGEGRQSRPVRFTTTDNVSAQIIPLARPVSVRAGRDLLLSCRHVGQPPPELTWKRNGQPLNPARFSRLTDSELTLTEVTNRDAGNYTCHVSNPYGSDSVTYDVTVLDVPPAPVLRVTDATSHSVMIRWLSGDPTGLAIRGFRLLYWPADGEVPAELALERFVREHQLRGLLCGTVYHLRLTAFNRLGQSEPSRTVKARTSGRPPVLSDPDRLVTVNDTDVTVQLHLWRDAGCAITLFTVRWRAAQGADTASVDLAGHTRQYVIRRLPPAGDYVINVTAQSPAGSASHVTAVRLFGSADLSAASGTADVRTGGQSVGLRVVVPVLAGLVSLVMIASAGYLCVRKRRRKVPLYLSEPPGYDEGTSDYSKTMEPPLPPQPSPRRPLQMSSGAPLDVCPYATFYPLVPERSPPPPPPPSAGHYASLLPPGAPPAADREGRYSDPRHHLSTLPVRDAKFQRGRSLPASDEYDSLDVDSDSASDPGRVRTASLRRGQHSLHRDMPQRAESSSSSCQLSPDLRSRSFSAKRTKRKRRRARTPVLMPPSAEFGLPGRSPADSDSRLLRQLKMQQQLAQPRPSADAELELRALAHRIKGQDFSINV